MVRVDTYGVSPGRSAKLVMSATLRFPCSQSKGPQVQISDDHAAGCSTCAIRSASICGALDVSELTELEHLAHARTYPARQPLFHQGEAGDYVFTIREGVIRLYALLADGRCQVLGFVLPGDFLGLALGAHYLFSAETVSCVEACRYDRRAFVDYVESKPHLLRSLHMATANELAMGREQMILLGRRTAEEKIAAFLLALRVRYRRVGACDVTIPLPMTRQDIADYCGLTLETVSRTFSKLAQQKVIVLVPNGVRLMMFDRLKSLAA